MLGRQAGEIPVLLDAEQVARGVGIGNPLCLQVARGVAEECTAATGRVDDPLRTSWIDGFHEPGHRGAGVKN